MDINKYSDFFIVCEAKTEMEVPKIISEKKVAGTPIVKFVATLQSFSERNRNRRMWYSKFVKPALETPEWKEMLDNNGMPGENGHPIPDTGQVTVERISTIDPNKISHFITKLMWEKNDTILKGEIETAPDAVGPGNTFMRYILAGKATSFSNRSLIPQRRNPDGTIDQTGVGRIITFDRVFLPSHRDAYRDNSVPLTEVLHQPKDLQYAIESSLLYALDESRKIDHVLEAYHPDMKSAILNKNYDFEVNAEEGRLIIPTEKYIKDEIRSYMMRF